MRKIVLAAALAAALALPVGARANHAGCLAHAAVPTCTYTAIGQHNAIPLSQASWEISVTRADVKVVLASGGPGAQFGSIVGIGAFPGELVTVSIASDGPGGQPVGAVTSGNTAGHI